ncbi:nucleotide-diphospho-sugar transferase [Teratosphaeria nubilosa]|uniref:Nucleotide-diphospho-sugar transferase n=1 Tax=Teratosphaeria nubilosa TaxID=161662 RepID=A0A6G1LAL9_9PEZI|nr:nucleotide-diphospho-sugar transferase [Teratosphaeria nubilosa]
MAIGTRSSLLASLCRGRGSICLWVAVTIVVVLALTAFSPLPDSIDEHRDALIENVKQSTGLKPKPPPHLDWIDFKQLENLTARNAYATFYSPRTEVDNVPMEQDEYFQAIRTLIYQTVHDKQTKSEHGYPMIVVISPDVSAEKQERMRRDGATVMVATNPDPGWVVTTIFHWKYMLTKLRLWQLTQFERICFFDGDTLLQYSMDGVFEDPAVKELQTSGTNASAYYPGEANVPATYSFVSEHNMRKHHWPPTNEAEMYVGKDYFNAGFFVLKPDNEMYDYYMSILHLPDQKRKKGHNLFDPFLGEQEMLNYAHRRSGNIPWLEPSYMWNVLYPSSEDLEGGVHSIHEKWWKPSDESLKLWDLKQMWKMQGFYEAQDALQNGTLKEDEMRWKWMKEGYDQLAEFASSEPSTIGILRSGKSRTGFSSN